MKKTAWIAGSVLGGTGVIAGAFGAHALKDKLSEQMLSVFETASKYQLVHALLLLIIGILIHFQPSKWLNFATIFSVVGIILFSGSLYILSITGIKQFGLITPIGGLGMIISWALITMHFTFQFKSK